MDYKTLKKELTKLANDNNVCLTFGEKKQFEKGCFLKFRLTQIGLLVVVDIGFMMKTVSLLNIAMLFFGNIVNTVS